MLDDLDAKTLVVGIGAREVAVGEETAGVVAAYELEFFPVAHCEDYLLCFAVSLSKLEVWESGEELKLGRSG